MKTYLVTRDFSGYVRGWETREVTAESEAEAKACFYQGIPVDENTVRDDTNTNDMTVEIKQ